MHIVAGSDARYFCISSDAYIAKKPIIKNSIRISLKETKTLLDQQCLCYEHRGEEAPQGSGFPSVTYRAIPQ